MPKDTKPEINSVICELDENRSVLVGELGQKDSFILIDESNQPPVPRPLASFQNIGKLLELKRCDAANLLLVSDSPIPVRILTTKDNWKTCSLRTATGALVQAAFSTETPEEEPQKSSLVKIRENGDFDFTIECLDGEIRVHSLIMSSRWPFFKAMKDSKMQEQKARRLKLAFPEATVEAMVSYLYEEHHPLDFETSLGLLEVAKMYDLPELLEEAEQTVTERDMSVDETLKAYRIACRADLESIRNHCCLRIKAFVDEPGETLTAELDELSQQELVRLIRYMDRLSVKV
ncbi:hypothetical protein CJU89_4742 [Yarrowia sp. B02]|nr:hypothetical protein CJU89_4742 [Yarrowia sp. B02]